MALDSPRSWVRVGYCAVRANEFRKCQDGLSNYADDPEASDYSPELSGFRGLFLESKLAAITYQRKEAMRRLGAAPSVADRPVKSRLRDARSGALQDAAFESQYVILTLYTKENLAEACSTGQLLVEDGGYRVSQFWNPVEALPFRNADSWSMDLERLGCQIS